MEFRTELIIPPYEKTIYHSQQLLSLGSCFAEVIGNKLIEYKFSVEVNPFGILFNPLSVAFLIEKSLTDQTLPEYSFVETQLGWNNLFFHSCIYAKTLTELQTIVRKKLEAFKEALLHSDWLILTFGTAFVYEHIPSGTTVSNCHKLAADLFRKKLISISDIEHTLRLYFTQLKKLNQNLNVILTVSPVRHIKDSLQLNSVSKSVLRIASHFLEEKLPYVYYFPAYELLTDDLRDYRFYSQDMLHPNKQAEEYIWEKFCTSFFSKETQKQNKEVKKVRKALEHKPFKSESESHKKFLSTLLEKLNTLNKSLDFEQEINWVHKQLRNV